MPMRLKPKGMKPRVPRAVAGGGATAGHVEYLSIPGSELWIVQLECGVEHGVEHGRDDRTRFAMFRSLTKRIEGSRVSLNTKPSAEHCSGHIPG